MNSCNGVQCVGLESGLILVGTDLGTVAGVAYFTQVYEVTGGTVAD